MVDTKLIKAIIKGLLSFLPGAKRLIDRKKSTTKHSGSQAEFCYTFWLSSLHCLNENGIQKPTAKVGEIGSGGSLGIGMCALLTGCEEFYALEMDQDFDKGLNLRILEELTLLFKRKTSISDKYNQLNIKAGKYKFPEELIEPMYLNDKLIEEIKSDILNNFEKPKRIFIVQNWEKQTSLQLDFIYSRAVLEHVNAPKDIYSAIKKHLKKGHYTLHDIELHSHSITKKPNGHYSIPTWLWSIIFGNRSYFLNRLQIQDHINCLVNENFEIVRTQNNYIETNGDGSSTLYGVVLIAKSFY